MAKKCRFATCHVSLTDSSRHLVERDFVTRVAVLVGGAVGVVDLEGLREVLLDGFKVVAKKVAG